jgi:hypothetical protein
MPSKYTQPPRENKNASAASNLPVRTFRLGRIKAAVWENESEQQKFYSVTFARTYVDDENKYHDSNTSVVMTCRWSPSWPITRTHSFSSGSRNSNRNRASDPRLGERPVIPAALSFYSDSKRSSVLTNLFHGLRPGS